MKIVATYTDRLTLLANHREITYREITPGDVTIVDGVAWRLEPSHYGQQWRGLDVTTELRQAIDDLDVGWNDVMQEER
jgi:hypothetical protein